ncbi:MAG TPA: hypothetical protein VGN01_15280, partial [Acidobacteriaceae bacterium]
MDCGEDDGFGLGGGLLVGLWLDGVEILVRGKGFGVLRLRAARVAQDDGLWGSGFSGRGFGWGCLFGGYFGDRSEVSEEGVGDDFLDERVGLSGGGFLWLGEVGGGDLEAVEEHACALEVD